MKVSVAKEALIEMAEWRLHDRAQTEYYRELIARKEQLQAELQEVERLMSEYVADIEKDIRRYKELPE